MIFDTRSLNSFFKKAHYTQLPTPASFSAIRIAEDHPLMLAQCDVDNAFYRLRAPPDMDEMFRLPPVDTESFRALCPEFASGLVGVKSTPHLIVLALGFSAVFRFIRLSGGRGVRLWPSVAKELRWMADLVCFAFTDCRRVQNGVVYATNASTGNDGDHGGYGVVCREIPAELARSVSRQSERWRFNLESAVAA